MSFTVAAFYRFVRIAEPQALCDELRVTFDEDELCGTVLIAEEGVNGTVAGSSAVVDALLVMLAVRCGLARGEVKFSLAKERPFGRLKIKVKPEILTFRDVEVDATKAGVYVEPSEWNALVSDPEVLLLDTRNRYEVEVGTFAGAVDPGIGNFSDFVTYARQNLRSTEHKKIAMFCTGGIRCEKASAFLLQEGFAEVFHLKGGILKYLEDVRSAESLWRGECFVFDRRRDVGQKDFE